MGKHRSLDADFWTSPKMRRYPLHCRTLLAALITTIADDEGRFDWTPEGLLDAVFARHDPVSEDDVRQDLAQLEADGIILAYGPDLQYGFLTAWYRRQVIDKRLRQPSGRPEPPVTPASPITSWAFAEALAGASCVDGKTKTWTAVACREFEALQPKEQDAVRRAVGKRRKEPFFTVQNREERADVDVDVDVDVDTTLTANDFNGTAPPVGDAPETPPEPPAPLPTPAPKAKAKPKAERPAEQDTPEQAVIRAAWEAHGFAGPPGGKEYGGLVKLVKQHGIPRIAQWAEHVRGDPPELPEGAEPHAWFAVQFRAAMARPWEWDGSRRPGGRHNGEAWILASDGTRWYERDWDPFDNLGAKLAQLKSSGNWIEARGVTKKPHPGFVCVDGWMYDSMGKPKNEVMVP